VCPFKVNPSGCSGCCLPAEGRVVTREELRKALRKALWPEDTFLDFELGVNTAVKKLRHSKTQPNILSSLNRAKIRLSLSRARRMGKCQP
jgi:hypothetical protein